MTVSNWNQRSSSARSTKSRTTPVTKSARKSTASAAGTLFDLGREGWVERLQHRGGNAGAIQIGDEVTQHSRDLAVVATVVVTVNQRAQVRF